MYYPRFTNVIINFFMTKVQSILRRNSVNWHYAKDDYMFTTIKVVSKPEDTQLYGAILPNELTNEDIKNSESYKEYYAIASGAEPLKTKASVKKKQVGSDKTTIPPIGKRLKTSAKAAKPAKKKQPTETAKAKGLTVLSKIDLTETEQLKLIIERSKTQTHSSHASGSGADEGTGAISGVLDVPTYNSDDEQISWKSNDDEEVQGVNIEGEEMDEEANNEESKGNELYMDLNVNLEGQDVEMTDAELPYQSSFVSSGFVSNMLNPRPDTSINSIFTLNTEATSLIDVPVTTIAEPPLLSTTTLPPPPTPLIIHMQQTPVPTPATVSSSSLQNLPNFGSLFRLRDEAQAKNADFLNKLDDNIKKIIKDQVNEQVKAQVSKILQKIEKIVNEQLEVKVMTRSSTESKTSLAIAANLSELELKKILIDKMESNKSIHRSDEQKNLYKALVKAYESDKIILDTYGDTVLFKRRRDDEDKDEEPSAGSNRVSKRRRAGKEPESTSTPKEKTPKSTRKSTEGSKSLHKSAGESAYAEDPMHTAKDLEEPVHQEFETGATEDQPVDETPQPSY
ncbi:hypothetical protein Tco_0818700 [Tanacetum coccineum]